MKNAEISRLNHLTIILENGLIYYLICPMRDSCIALNSNQLGGE
jgi:hypothetical protein